VPPPSPRMDMDMDMDNESGPGEFDGVPQLHEALSTLNELLLPVYAQADRAALRNQKLHRRLTIISVICGTVAVVFAVAQLGLVQLSSAFAGHVGWIRIGEQLAVVFGLLSVSLGIIATTQTSWLRERHKAERCRLLKFRFLAHRALWCQGMSGIEAWRQELRRQIEQIQAIDREEIKAWADADKPFHVPLPISTCALSPRALRALVDYYTEKRVAVQSAYFHERSLQYEGRDRKLRLLPAACFFLSVTFALLHSLADLLWNGHEGSHSISIWLILLAACLPVIGGGVRTYRSAHEFARSASLFHAKHHNLEDLKKELELADTNNPDAVMRLIWKCEDYLEREHREWLWLMLEAEWFG
jgi:hypothetical protein